MHILYYSTSIIYSTKTLGKMKNELNPNLECRKIQKWNLIRTDKLNIENCYQSIFLKEFTPYIKSDLQNLEINDLC